MRRSALPHSAFAALFLILSLVQYLSHNLGLTPPPKVPPTPSLTLIRHPPPPPWQHHSTGSAMGLHSCNARHTTGPEAAPQVRQRRGHASELAAVRGLLYVWAASVRADRRRVTPRDFLLWTWWRLGVSPCALRLSWSLSVVSVPGAVRACVCIGCSACARLASCLFPRRF